MSEPVGDCYSAGERRWMVATQRVRSAALDPILRLCERAGVTPDHVTLASLAAGLAFWPLWTSSPAAALAALFLHVVLDGVDGPLARHTGVASRRGSFTDTLCDQAVVTASTIALMSSGKLGVVPGALYVYVYAVVVAFAMVRNSLEIPYAWLVRPRLVVYGWIAVEVAWAPGWLDALVWASAGVLTLKMLSGFWRLRARL
ncbi:MAG: CDP-alcohol phosphatidyltransferase family protein [Planctomycetota bacterium]